jgi:hypothetical protein
VADDWGGILRDSIVVTGCDANHYELAAELLLSLRAMKSRSFTVGFIQVGDVPPPDSVVSRADILATVSTDKFALTPNEGFQLAYLAVKTRLPEFFPGYQTYIWLDADTWVQREAGLHEIAQAARVADLSIHPQIDPNYFACQFPDNYTLSVYKQMFGEQDRNKFSRFPMVNAGVFGAFYSSPVWKIWKESLDEVKNRLIFEKERFFSDQIPLHRLIYQQRLRICPLRAVNNWLALHSIPRFDRETRLLTAPTPPHEAINIIHLVGSAKSRQLSIDGVPVSLRYGDMRRMLLQ